MAENQPQYRRILVSTDFSPASQAAIPYANRLALTHGAQILLAHVVAQPPYLPYGFSVDEVPIEDAPLIEKLEGHLQATAELFDSEVEVTTKLLRGVAHEELTGMVEAEDIDLIVMSTSGHSGLERFFLGSVVEKVIRSAKCPVMVVPPGE